MILTIVAIPVAMIGLSHLYVHTNYDIKWAMGKKDAEWVIGKTPEEIQEKYGEFYSYREGYYDESRQQFIQGSAKYVTKWAWDDYDQTYFSIGFDETGKAFVATENFKYPVP